MDPYSTLKVDANRRSEAKNSFVFWVKANSQIRLPSPPDQPRKFDGAALHLLALLIHGLQARGLAVAEPEFNKTGQACSSVRVADVRMSLILGIERKEEQVVALLVTWERKPKGKYFPSASSASASEELRDTIYHILRDEVRVDSLQRTTEREAGKI